MTGFYVCLTQESYSPHISGRKPADSAPPHPTPPHPAPWWRGFYNSCTFHAVLVTLAVEQIPQYWCSMSQYFYFYFVLSSGHTLNVILSGNKKIKTLGLWKGFGFFSCGKILFFSSSSFYNSVWRSSEFSRFHYSIKMCISQNSAAEQQLMNYMRHPYNHCASVCVCVCFPGRVFSIFSQSSK